jgi:deferrochelatase/peroxidase EfeB
MEGTLQEGIYYNRPPGNSFCLIFLRISKSVRSSELAKDLSELWALYGELKRGKTKDLPINSKHSYHGNLSVLLGYGPKIFDGIVSGIKKNKPKDFIQEKGFKGPNILGGEPIVGGTSINFSKNIVKNHAVDEHIIIQFIADAEMFTNRAVVETWKHINNRKILNISKFYTGFKRMDQRGWLGFHEGIANINPNERLEAISINNSVSNQDKWLINGTYMAFIRFEIDLEKWVKQSLSEQELIIGRKKLTGCPITGVDKNGNPISDPNCPMPGTAEVIDEGNEQFRQHPKLDEKDFHRYGKDKSLSTSHIYRVHKPNIHPPSDYRSFRIFRQGYEFLESIEKYPGFQAGLNFVSFQNNPQKVMKILSLPEWLGRSINTAYSKNTSILETFTTAQAAGIYLIPPFNKNELFPGNMLL